MEDLGLEVETLEDMLHVSSHLGARVSVDQICRGYELEISMILLTVDLRVMDMSEFDVILGMDWLTAHRVVIDCDHMRVVGALGRDLGPLASRPLFDYRPWLGRSILFDPQAQFRSPNPDTLL